MNQPTATNSPTTIYLHIKNSYFMENYNKYTPTFVSISLLYIMMIEFMVSFLWKVNININLDRMIVNWRERNILASHISQCYNRNAIIDSLATHIVNYIQFVTILLYRAVT